MLVYQRVNPKIFKKLPAPNPRTARPENEKNIFLRSAHAGDLWIKDPNGNSTMGILQRTADWFISDDTHSRRGACAL